MLFGEKRCGFDYRCCALGRIAPGTAPARFRPPESLADRFVRDLSEVTSHVFREGEALAALGAERQMRGDGEAPALGKAARGITQKKIVTDVVGGHITSSISETGAALSLIVDGKLKALGITASSPHPSLPQVPTVAEAMGMPGFEAVSWHVLLAPAATPQPIVARLYAEMKRITGDAAFQKRVSDVGLMPLPPRSMEEIQAYIKGERERWGGVVTQLGLAGTL